MMAYPVGVRATHTATMACPVTGRDASRDRIRPTGKWFIPGMNDCRETEVVAIRRGVMMARVVPTTGECPDDRRGDDR
jgi:hypothetical protein